METECAISSSGTLNFKDTGCECMWIYIHMCVCIYIYYKLKYVFIYWGT